MGVVPIVTKKLYDRWKIDTIFTGEREVNNDGILTKQFMAFPGNNGH